MKAHVLAFLLITGASTIVVGFVIHPAVSLFGVGMFLGTLVAKADEDIRKLNSMQGKGFKLV